MTCIGATMSNESTKLSYLLSGLSVIGRTEEKKKALVELQSVGDAECIDYLIHKLNDEDIGSEVRETLEIIIRRMASSIDEKVLSRLRYLSDIKRVEHHSGRYRSGGEENWSPPWNETVYWLNLSSIRELAEAELQRRQENR